MEEGQTAFSFISRCSWTVASTGMYSITKMDNPSSWSYNQQIKKKSLNFQTRSRTQINFPKRNDDESPTDLSIKGIPISFSSVQINDWLMERKNFVNFRLWEMPPESQFLRLNQVERSEINGSWYLCVARVLLLLQFYRIFYCLHAHCTLYIARACIIIKRKKKKNRV